MPLEYHRSVMPVLLRDRRFHLLLGLGIILRLWIGADVWSHDPTARALLSDSLYYKDWAEALRGGAPFAGEGPDLAYWMPPFYPWLLAQLGASVKAMLLLQGVLGLLTTGLVVALGERLLGTPPSGTGQPLAPAVRRRAALLGGLLWTLYGPVLFFEGRLLGATLATFLGTAGLLAAVLWRDRVLAERARALPLLAAAGLAFGAMALARPNTLLALPAVGLWVLWIAQHKAALGRVLLQGALFAVAALAPLAPALQHNWRATGHLVPVTVNGGVNFYFANNPASHGTFHAPGIQWGSIADQRRVARSEAALALGVPAVDDVEASSYWMGRGMDFLLSDPAGATRLWALKFADLMSSTEFGIQYNLSAARHQAPSLWAVGLPFGALLLLIALGWRSTGTRILWPWLLAGLASALLYFTYSRFRLPLLPPLMGCAGLGLERLVRGRVRPVAGFVGLALAALSFLNFEGTYPEHLRSKAFLDMARASEDAVERRALLDQALVVLPGNKPALVERARLAHALQQDAAALGDLEAACNLPVDYPFAELEFAYLLANTEQAELRDSERARRVLEAWLARHDAAHPFAEEFRLLLGQLP